MNILFPVGRMIGGSLAKVFPATDNLGNPKKNAQGEVVNRCNFGVAIPKGPEAGWWETPWGQEIYKVGVEGFPKGEYRSHTFAWKVTDGDSNIPNKRGKLPREQTGYPGNWVVWFSQSWLPKKVNANGTQELTDPEAIVPGYFVQVYGDVTGNKSDQSPGVYLNPVAVALVGYGERIASDVDTTAVGFGKAALPAGASATPIGMTGSPGPAMGGPAAGPTPPTGPTPPVGGGPAGPGPMPPGVKPAPDFLNGPGPMGGSSALGGPPPVVTGPIYAMTKLAKGTREAYHAAGWTDELLLQHGLMVKDDVPY